MSAKTKAIFTIPAGLNFAGQLAKELLKTHADKPEELAKIKILLPTRRSCRTLRETFATLTPNKNIILPHLQPLGDVDEEELSLSLVAGPATNDLLKLPPALPVIKRQILLAKLILKLPGYVQDYNHALKLANALGRFMDQIYTEDLDMTDLETLVPEDFAEHWQITLTFLQIISRQWPAYLKDNNIIDAADRRKKLLTSLNEHWSTNPPKTSIIAAGTTGSIPSVAKLLRTISELPKGKIILPGLDKNLDEESWSAIDDTHPQFGLKKLLDFMDVPREAVIDWGSDEGNITSKARRELASDLMKPAKTTYQWTQAKPTLEIRKALENLQIYECDHEDHEAETIAIALREILEDHNKTAALITPDKNLSLRVKNALKRWDIKIDDSVGQSLNKTVLGQFFMLIIKTVTTGVTPSTLLSLLRNPICSILSEKEIPILETYLLRGPKPPPGFIGLKKWLKNKEEEAYETLDEDQKKSFQTIKTLLEKLEEAFKPLIKLDSTKNSMRTIVLNHVQVIETTSDRNYIWTEEAGKTLSKTLSELIGSDIQIGKLSLSEYESVLQNVFENVVVRQAESNTHSRLKILGQLEARMVHADLMVLGGLNEGVWPSETSLDPWMSRPMRIDFGLPSTERGIGLSAHDFVQGFCAPRVIITRSKRSGSSPALPSRWLLRLETILDTYAIEKEHLYQGPHAKWAKKIDKQEAFNPSIRPAPRPLKIQRPKRISVTRIQTFLEDPYGLYARYVLNLKPILPLEQKGDKAIRGALLHKVMERFVSKIKGDLPANPEEKLTALARKVFDESGYTKMEYQFWWPRLEKLCIHLMEYEKEWRKKAKPLKLEIKGQIKIIDTLIEGRIDRIDYIMNKGLAIIDYKSAGTYTASQIKNGQLPQLLVEGLIASEGGFAEISEKNVSVLAYWIMKGSEKEPFNVISLENPDKHIAETKEKLSELINVFSKEETPYLCIPRNAYIPRYNDYEHLSRIKEWNILPESEAA